MPKPDRERRWYCQANETGIQGPGFDFSTLVSVENGHLVVLRGDDPEHPILIPLALLENILRKAEG